MIKYEPQDSAFYKHNQKYCHNIEDQLKDKNINYSGFCNAYGYEIQSGWKQADLKFHLKIKKEQSTQNGVVVPVNAFEQTVSTYKIDGIDPKICIKCGRSVLRRLFMKSRHKNHFSSPHYLLTRQNPDSKMVKLLSALVTDYNILTINAKDGKMHVVSQMEIQKPMNLIETLLKMLGEWK